MIALDAGRYAVLYGLHFLLARLLPRKMTLLIS